MSYHPRYHLMTGWCHGSNRSQLFQATIIQPYPVIFSLSNFWQNNTRSPRKPKQWHLCSFCEEMMRSCWNKRWWAAHWSLDRNFKPHLKFAAGFAHCCNMLPICFCNIFEIVAILRIFATFDNFLQFCALVQHLTIVLPIDQHLLHLLSQKCMFGKCNLKKFFLFFQKVYFLNVYFQQSNMSILWKGEHYDHDDLHIQSKAAEYNAMRSSKRSVRVCLQWWCRWSEVSAFEAARWLIPSNTSSTKTTSTNTTDTLTL